MGILFGRLTWGRFFPSSEEESERLMTSMFLAGSPPEQGSLIIGGSRDPPQEVLNYDQRFLFG